MKKETKERIRKSLAQLERALDERNEYMAARRAYLFVIPGKRSCRADSETKNLHKIRKNLQ